MHRSTKTYGNEVGLSCCFRQWRADSHCNKLHGYSLGFRFTFEAANLDEHNWVYDFGDCKWIKAYLQDKFDHKLVVARDDPILEDEFLYTALSNIADIRYMDNVGSEKFAESVYNHVAPKIKERTKGRVSLFSVECFEHGANSASYQNPYGSSVI
jgi:6-pyruvoyltetrahydropterin/6-carboxytetrahydropterin synthase